MIDAGEERHGLDFRFRRQHLELAFELARAAGGLAEAAQVEIAGRVPAEAEQRIDRVRRLRRPRLPALEDPRCARRRQQPADPEGRHLGHRVHLEAEGGRHAERAAAATTTTAGPEQIRVLLGVGLDRSSVGHAGQPGSLQTPVIIRFCGRGGW